MSYCELSLNGDLNPCYFYMQQLKYCASEKLYVKTDCKNQIQDFLECHGKQKQNKILAEANRQLRKAKVISVPTYDRANDQFVYDDGRVVSNTDPIFTRFKWM